MMNKLGNIKIRGEGSTQAVIDIEGVIGLPEEWQFEDQIDRVATYDKFRDTLESIKALKTPQVRVNIRSMGGSVEDALLIYEALCSLDAQVTTYCQGYVASAATIIAQSGAMRYISGGAMYLIHNATISMDGNKEEAIRTAGILSKTDQRIARIYADRSGSGVEVFEELMGLDGGRGQWLSPEETVEFGLADKVVEFSAIKNLGQKILNFAKSLGVEFGQLIDQTLDGEPRQGLEPLLEHKSEKQLIVSDTAPKRIEDRSADDAKEGENTTLRRQVGATRTESREDPALETTRQSRNQGAYADDVELFRSSIV